MYNLLIMKAFIKKLVEIKIKLEWMQYYLCLTWTAIKKIFFNENDYFENE